MTDALTEASHRLCEALHAEFIDPGQVEIHLPKKAWWRLCCLLEQRYRGTMLFDGRGTMPPPASWVRRRSGRLRWMNIVYVAKDE